MAQPMKTVTGIPNSGEYITQADIDSIENEVKSAFMGDEKFVMSDDATKEYVIFDPQFSGTHWTFDKQTEIGCCYSPNDALNLAVSHFNRKRKEKDIAEMEVRIKHQSECLLEAKRIIDENRQIHYSASSRKKMLEHTGGNKRSLAAVNRKITKTYVIGKGLKLAMTEFEEEITRLKGIKKEIESNRVS